MLLRFEVSNHRSILDPVEFSMVAVDEDREATRKFEGLPQSVLTVAGIYGPNASGKSNILDAINWLSYAVGTSLLGGGDHIARDSHRFGDGSELPSRFDMDLLVDGVRHGYQLEVSDTAVLYEGLCSYPERRRRVLFEREGAEVDFRRGLDGTSAIRELLTPSTLVLTAAMRVGDQSIKSVGRAISGISEINARMVPERWGSPPHDFAVRSSNSSALLEDKGSRDRLSLGPLKVGEGALKLLGLADPGIVDFDILPLVRPTTNLYLCMTLRGNKCFSASVMSPQGPKCCLGSSARFLMRSGGARFSCWTRLARVFTPDCPPSFSNCSETLRQIPTEPSSYLPLTTRPCSAP